MQHNFSDFLRNGGDGQYGLAQRDGHFVGRRVGLSLKSTFPNYSALRDDFGDRLDQVISENTRMLLNALTPPDTVPTEAMRDRRVDDARARLGVDATTVEGRLAATAYALVQEGISSGLYPVLPKNPEFARIGAEAAALYELLNPGTILETSAGGDPVKQRALQDFIEAAGKAFKRGDLRLQEGELAQGWVEAFPELTDGERRLGELPGFTPERIEQWLETYPIEELGLPHDTGTPIPGDPTDNVISTPIPEEARPSIVEARPENTTTPDGNSILPHGAKGDGEEYITGKGHTAEQIDDIIANPRPELSGVVAGIGIYKGQDMTLLTGQDGHWVVLDPSGNVIAVSNRNVPLGDNENTPREIVRPLE